MCHSNHVKKEEEEIQRALMGVVLVESAATLFLKPGFISSRCVAVNEHLFTSPDTLSVYLIANTAQIVT